MNTDNRYIKNEHVKISDEKAFPTQSQSKILYDNDRTINKKDCDVTEINNQFSLLLNSITEVKKSFSVLVKKIEPVLSPLIKCSDDIKCSPEKETLSPLAADIRSMTNTVNGLNYEMYSIIDRIEL